MTVNLVSLSLSAVLPLSCRSTSPLIASPVMVVKISGLNSNFHLHQVYDDDVYIEGKEYHKRLLKILDSLYSCM